MIKERAPSDNIMRRKVAKHFVAETNVAKKLRELRETFGLRVNSRSHIERVSMARNVLQHAAGIVRNRECIHQGHFELTWLGFDTRVVGESTGAVENIITDVLREPHMSQDPEGCTIGIIFVDRKRIFSEGQMIDLTPHDLHEICYMYQRQAAEIQSQMTMRVEYVLKDEMEMREILAAKQQPDT